MAADPDLVERAHEFCISAHAGQTRDDGRPYHTHPQAVVDVLKSVGVADRDVLAAAYLHDVLEDTAVSADELALRFGPAVTDLVEELTNPDYPGRTFEEKHRMLADKARRMSDRARLIKLADRLHNLQNKQFRTAERQRRYAEVTAELLDALRPWPSEVLAERIQALIRPHLGEAGDIG